MLYDITDGGDLDASMSSTLSTDKSKTKKAASYPCKISVCRIVDVENVYLQFYIFAVQ